MVICIKGCNGNQDLSWALDRQADFEIQSAVNNRMDTLTMTLFDKNGTLVIPQKAEIIIYDFDPAQLPRPSPTVVSTSMSSYGATSYAGSASVASTSSPWTGFPSSGGIVDPPPANTCPSLYPYDEQMVLGETALVQPASSASRASAVVYARQGSTLLVAATINAVNAPGPPSPAIADTASNVWNLLAQVQLGGASSKLFCVWAAYNIAAYIPGTNTPLTITVQDAANTALTVLIGSAIEIYGCVPGLELQAVSTAQGSSTTLATGSHSNLNASDLGLALFGFDQNPTTVSTPSGFTLQAQRTQGSGTSGANVWSGYDKFGAAGPQSATSTSSASVNWAAVLVFLNSRLGNLKCNWSANTGGLDANPFYWDTMPPLDSAHTPSSWTPRLFAGFCAQPEYAITSGTERQITVSAQDYTLRNKTTVVYKQYSPDAAHANGWSDAQIVRDVYSSTRPDIDTLYVQQLIANLPSLSFPVHSLEQTMQKIIKLSAGYYRVDYFKRLYYGALGWQRSPFDVSDTPNISATPPTVGAEQLKFGPDSSNLENRIWVTGGKFTGQLAPYQIPTSLVDGATAVFPLPAFFQGLKGVTITVNGADQGSIGTLGRDGQLGNTSAWSLNALVSLSANLAAIVAFKVAPPASAKVVVTGQYVYPLIQIVQSAALIAATGGTIFEGILHDTRLRSSQEAIALGQGHLQLQGASKGSGSCMVRTRGLNNVLLQVGMNIMITNRALFGAGTNGGLLQIGQTDQTRSAQTALSLAGSLANQLPVGALIVWGAPGGPFTTSPLISAAPTKAASLVISSSPTISFSGGWPIYSLTMSALINTLTTRLVQSSEQYDVTIGFSDKPDLSDDQLFAMLTAEQDRIAGELAYGDVGTDLLSQYG